MVPGLEAAGLVAPRRTRPVLTASRPSQTMAQIGPEPMSNSHIRQHSIISVWLLLFLLLLSRGDHLTGHQTLEERLGAQVLVVLLEVLL